MTLATRYLLLILAAVTLIGSGAGCSAQARKNRHLKRAANYFAAGKLDQAEIEYINALELAPSDADAISGLGLIYFDQGRVGKVFTYLNKAQELRPDNLAIRVALARVYLTAGRLKETRDEATFVLQKDPANAEAPVLLAEGSVAPAELAASRTALQQLPADVTARAPVLTALAIIDARSKDAKAAAEKLDRAEAADPKYSIAHLWRAALYRSENDAAHSEQEFAAAARLSPPRSPARTQYAQFEIQTGHPDVARKTLEEVIAQAPDCLPPYLMLAEMDASDKKLDDALALVTKVLNRDPTQPDAITLQARLHTAKGEPDKAIADLERGVGLYDESAAMHYQLALAYMSTGDLNKATSALTQALRINQDFPLATLVLADIQVRQGNSAAAVTTLKQLIQRHPEMPQPRLALAGIFNRQRDYENALAIYRQLDAAFPHNPQTSLLIGLTLVRQRKPADARQAFEHALELRPDYLPALEQIVDLDLTAKNFASAHKRIAVETEKNPNAVGPLLLLAKVYVAERDNKNAETTLQRVIALQPDQVLPYVMLARLYIGMHEEDKAVANLQTASRNNPKDVEPLMLIAVLYDQQKNYPAARTAYEKLLELNPRFGAALNNLAYLYSEQFHELDKAFQAAQRARELSPNEPHTADTLGWILYQRGQYTWALSLLAESADKLPDIADVQYHLGMTQYMLGNERPARAALEQALKLSTDFPGAANARQRLDVLALDPATAGADVVTRLEKQVEAQPDPIAYTRLGEIYERGRDNTKAMAAYQAALKLSATNSRAILGTCRLYRAQNQLDKALELAKSARKTAPTDPELTRMLGELAFDTGDYSWSASLLQEAVRAMPDDAETQFAFAQAAYATGQVDAAQGGFQQALTTGLTGASQAKAQSYLRMLGAVKSPGDADVAAAKSLLAADGTFVPALMVVAARQEHDGEVAGAQKTYDQVVARYADFTPAKKRLVLLYAQSAQPPAGAVALAAKVRASLPDDPEVARASGIIAYKAGDFAQAATLLKNTEGQKDADVLYYLGMSQFRMNRKAESRQALQAFITMDSRSERAAEARKILEKL